MSGSDPALPNLTRLESRVTELEHQWMHVQRDVEMLNETVLHLGRQIELLQKQFQQFSTRLALLQFNSEAAPPPDEKPPHY